MSNLLSTKELSKHMEYFDTPCLFFSEFKNAWNNVQFQVLKLETRQNYTERGSKSLEEMIKGNIENAVNLLPMERACDVNLYMSLKNKNVDFIRCRPVVLPLTDYLKWEIQGYHFNAQFNEQIYFLHRNQEKIIFDKLALHDFMIFDKDVAFIHNYDDNGEILGGWKTINSDYIKNLIYIFGLIKSVSQKYDYFLKINNL